MINKWIITLKFSVHLKCPWGKMARNVKSSMLMSFLKNDLFITIVSLVFNFVNKAK